MAFIFRQTFREANWGHMHFQFKLIALSLDNIETGTLYLMTLDNIETGPLLLSLWIIWRLRHNYFWQSFSSNTAT